MTQVLFAQYMGVSNKTVESWEKGTNHPTGTACRLISMLENKTFEILPFVKKTATVSSERLVGTHLKSRKRRRYVRF